MPSGGGFAGGGGGGGGGGGTYDSGSSGGGGGNACTGIVACIFLFVMVVVIFVPIHVTMRNRYSVPVFYSPGDTRLASYNTLFCAGITLRDNSNMTTASLFLIEDTPPLVDRNNFTVNSTVTLTPNEYRYWNYYLYPNSNFSAKVCLLHSSRGANTLYLIRGKGNFEGWRRSPSTEQAVTFTDISNAPPCFTSTQQFSYRADVEDEYYFVYYSSPSNRGDLQLNLIMSFERFQYSTTDLDSEANCTVPSVGECTIPVPYGSNYRALIATDIPENVDWEENVDVSWSCANREWAYTVVILVPLTVVIGVCTLCAVVCFRPRKKHPLVKRTYANKTPPTTYHYVYGGDEELTELPPPPYTASVILPPYEAQNNISPANGTPRETSV